MGQMNDISLTIRQTILKMAMRANGGHIAPSFSIVDIIVELYFDQILKFDPLRPGWDKRDYFILSKGHGALALYVALAMTGYFPMEDLKSFCRKGSELGSLAKSGGVPGIEASTGSLGHGLSYATGIALALKKDGLNNHIYVLVGDGECEEGSIWEAVMFATHNKLDNLTVIVDNNGLQAMDSLDNIMSLNKLSEKFECFGFSAVDIDGHNYSQIKKALLGVEEDRPRAVIAHTIKGKGISFMENVPIWHYRIPNENELDIALNELRMTREDLGEYERSVFRNII